jgi:hypothetical protein
MLHQDGNLFELNVKLLCQNVNPLNAELNPVCHLLALLGAHLILHVGKIRVKLSSMASIGW